MYDRKCKINQQFKDMPILEKAAIILKLYGASNLLYNSILKLAFVVAEIIGLYRYYDRLIKLKNSLIPETEEQKFENSLKKILIGMPKIKERKPNDKYTALTRVQTIIFFKFLQKANYFFKDYSLQSRGNMMLALRALTGFSADTLEKDLGIEKFDDEDIKATQKFLEKLSHLKINKLR